MLNERVSPQTLGVVRVVVFGLWFLNVSMIHLEDLAALPRELLSPYGMLWLIPRPLWQGMWTPAFLAALRVLLLAGLAWLILGLPRYRGVAIATCLLLTLFDGMEKSLGHINHSKFVMLYAAYILAAFPSADALSLSRRPREPAAPVQYAAPVLAIALVFVVAYSFMGAFRIGRGGFDLIAGDAIENWFLRRSYEANSTGFRIGIWVCEHAPALVLTKLGFAVVTIMELLSPLCLISRWFRWAWIATFVPFHVASLLTMNIFFWQNALLMLLVMTDCDRVFAPRPARGEAPLRL